MKNDKTHSNRVYKLIIILMLIIMGYMYWKIFVLSKNAENYERHKRYGNEQIQMIVYICEHREGIKSYGQFMLDNKVTDMEKNIFELEKNDLSYFYDSNNSTIDFVDEFTIKFSYKINIDIDDTAETIQYYEFFYVSEINDENSGYIKDCYKIDDNIFAKPYVSMLIPWV